jgi:hypothetical protein
MSALVVGLARQVARLHWRVARTPLLGNGYTRGLRQFNNLRDKLSFLGWRLLKSSPRLNRRRVENLLRNSGSTAMDQSPVASPIDGRLIVRIAFHFSGKRLKFLIEMLKQIKELPFREVVVAIDTNSPETQRYLISEGIDFLDEVVLYEKLADPFKLTWMHRGHLKAAINDFDYFMYAEDDLLITPASIRIWHERLAALKAHGYLPGFLRVEENREGALVASDYMRTASAKDIVTVDGQSYLHTPFPYQAFWIYDKATMRAFIDSEVYETGQPNFDTRECMASGFTYKKVAGEWRSRHLLPLNEHGVVDPRCFVYHMPSNYGRLLIPHPGRLGTIPVGELIDRTSSTRG